EPTRDYWYRGAPEDVKQYVYGRKAAFDRETGIVYRTSDPQRELYGMLQARLAPVLGSEFDIAKVPDATLRRDLQSLASVRGASLAWLPETVFVRIDDAPEASRYVTLLRDTAHLNVSHVFLEKGELVPAENALTVVPGFIGAYPNAIYRVTRAELPALTAAIGALGSEADYRALADRYAIRRTNPAFWAASDALIDAYAKRAPVEAGLFDYNRLENR
ncbi:MAG: fatty acid cis/trans isomerase, partial [Myxococcota bacterium]|nr:fatty acid cis/trans isomerase [Myxococcota bacterium]